VRHSADYTHRAHWNSSDEIGQLVTAFNDMLAQLDRDRIIQQEQAALAGAAQAQRELVEGFPTPMVVTSVPDHEVLHANAPALTWLGDCRRDPWAVGLEPHVRARFFQRLADHGAVDEFEVRWLAGAAPSWAVLSARRLQFQGREAVLTAFAPINKLKQLEQRLELWAKVFEASSESIVIMNAQRQVISVNQSFCRSTSYDFHEVIGADFAMLVDSPQALKWTQHPEKDVWQGEVMMRRMNGDLYPAWLMVFDRVQGLDQWRGGQLHRHLHRHDRPQGARRAHPLPGPPRCVDRAAQPFVMPAAAGRGTGRGAQDG
jgi:PAS domain-containing protein